MTQPPKHKPPVRHGRSDSADAFLPDPGEGPARTKDALAEELAEEFVSSATRGGPTLLEDRDNEITDEEGGPFIETTGKQEFAKGVDASNPRGAKKEAFPTANARPPNKPRG